MHEVVDTKILVVDDDRSNLNLITTLLSYFNFKLLSAESSEEAIQIAKQEGDTIDLLLTDIVLPEANGIELAKFFSDSFPDTKILFMSGSFNDIDRRYGVTLHKEHFIEKPFAMETFVNKVRTILKSNSLPFAMKEKVTFESR